MHQVVVWIKYWGHMISKIIRTRGEFSVIIDHMTTTSDNTMTSFVFSIRHSHSVLNLMIAGHRDISFHRFLFAIESVKHNHIVYSFLSSHTHPDIHKHIQCSSLIINALCDCLSSWILDKTQIQEAVLIIFRWWIIYVYQKWLSVMIIKISCK